MPPTARDIVDFWRDAGPDRWFARDDAFDARCRELVELHHRAARRELEDWMDSAEGALALVLLLDQIPRNVFRDSGHAYATDPLARHYADRAIALAHDRNIDPALRVFFNMPFEHSESLEDQDRCVALCDAMGDAERKQYLSWAVGHRDVIRRFGRFPHRNRILGRASTPQEQAYLDAGGGFT